MLFILCITFEFDLQYTTHWIEGKDDSPLPFVFNDIMGLERDEGEGVHTLDITTAIQGFLEEGHKVRKFCTH